MTHNKNIKNPRSLKKLAKCSILNLIFRTSLIFLAEFFKLKTEIKKMLFGQIVKQALTSCDFVPKKHLQKFSR